MALSAAAADPSDAVRASAAPPRHGGTAHGTTQRDDRLAALMAERDDVGVGAPLGVTLGGMAAMTLGSPLEPETRDGAYK